MNERMNEWTFKRTPTHRGAVICSSVVERLLMVAMGLRIIPHGGIIELFLVPAIASQAI